MSFTARPFSCKSNSFEWFRTGTRFENEAKDNSEMAYTADICELLAFHDNYAGDIKRNVL